MSWIFFILRYDGVLMKICLETKNVLEIMNDSNLTVAGRITNFLYFSQVLLKGILKIYKYEHLVSIDLVKLLIKYTKM